MVDPDRAGRPVDPGGDQPHRRHATWAPFQLWTTVLKFVPLALMATVGLFFISTGNFTPWNTSGDSNLSAIGGAMAICLFSYLGVETAAVAAAKVRDPERNVPEPTIYGTLASAVVYLLSMVAVFGIVPTQRSPWTTTRRPTRPPPTPSSGGSWAGNLVAALVVISGHRRAERLDDDLRRDAARSRQGRAVPEAVRAAVPPRRAGVRHRRVDALACVAVVISYLGTSGATVFTTLVLMTGITAAIPYAFSALAQIIWRLRDGRPCTHRGSPATSPSRSSRSCSRCCSSTTPATPATRPGTWCGDRS